MEKRLLLAIGLSLLVLLSWSAMMPKTQTVGVKEVMTQVREIAPVQSAAPVAQAVLPLASPESTLEYKQENLEAVFIEHWAAIKSVSFKNYKDALLPLSFGFGLNDKTLVFKKVNQTPDSLTFVHLDASKKITKKFIFHKSNYTIDLNINIQNLTSSDLKMGLPLILGKLDLSAQNKQAQYQDITAATQEKTTHTSAQKNMQFWGVKFLSLRDRYFCAIIEPVSAGYSGFVQKLNPKESEVGLNAQDFVVPGGGQIGHLFHIYIGPQDHQILNQIKPDWTSVIYFGTFDFISQILLQSLEFFQRIFHSWGWAIILLSILIYLVLYPLSVKQMRSMKEMQAVQPLVEEIRKQYKDNPQKMNKEIMELYRKHKVNPFGGCLPLILQMPIFFALYNALMRSVALRGANFLWIKDLSEPDRLFTLPSTIPLLGNELNILPIIMAIGMFFQQRVSSAAASGASAEQQKIMLIVMPVMFGFIFYRMPAGLVLYWLINSILMLVFQLRMNKSK